MLSLSREATLVVLPEVPKQGQPVIATFTLKNPSPETTRMRYEFYATGSC